MCATYVCCIYVHVYVSHVCVCICCFMYTYMCLTYVYVRDVCVHQAQFVTYVCLAYKCIPHMQQVWATLHRLTNVQRDTYTCIRLTHVGFHYVHVSHICVSHMTCMCLRHSS